MFRTDKTIQDQLFFSNIRDLIPQNSDVFLYIDLFEQIDLSKFENNYKSQGEKAIHPALVLRTIFYGLTHGICSAVKLDIACQFDSRYIVLSGDQRPDRSTLSRFLIRHANRIDELFGTIVVLAQKMGLVELGNVAIDGKKFKGQTPSPNTSKHKAMSFEYMQKAQERIKEELRELTKSLSQVNSEENNIDDRNLKGEIAIREKRMSKISAALAKIREEANNPKETQAAKRKTAKIREIKAPVATSPAPEIPPKIQKSFNDLDAKPFMSAGNGFNYVHNMQIAVDGKSQIVVGAIYHDNVTDIAALTGVMNSIKENCSKKPENILADAGYKSGENLVELEAQGVVPVVAIGKGESENEQTVADILEYIESEDCYYCPENKRLNNHATCCDGRRDVSMNIEECRHCCRQKICPLFGKKGHRVRLPAEKNRAALKRNRERLLTEKGKELYKRRKAIVEPVFGNFVNKGMKLSVIGKQKVKTTFIMFAIAHNIEKLIGSISVKRNVELVSA